MPIKTYSFEDGKYEIDRDPETGFIKDMRRHGEHWTAGLEGNQHSKLFHHMLNRIDELEAGAAP